MRIAHTGIVNECGICKTCTDTLVTCIMCEHKVCPICEDVFQLSEFFPDVCKQCATIPKVVELRELYRHHHTNLRMGHENELIKLLKKK